MLFRYPFIETLAHTLVHGYTDMHKNTCHAYTPFVHAFIHLLSVIHMLIWTNFSLSLSLSQALLCCLTVSRSPVHSVLYPWMCVCVCVFYSSHSYSHSQPSTGKLLHSSKNIIFVIRFIKYTKIATRKSMFIRALKYRKKNPQTETEAKRERERERGKEWESENREWRKRTA